MKELRLSGTLTALVTPFSPNGDAVDVAALDALVEAQIEGGVSGLVPCGTTGEAPTLSDDERFALYEAAVDEVGDRATVVAGTGTYSTAHSVHLTERAHEIGVDAFLIVTPYYSKPPVRGIVEHFGAIAAVSGKPLVVYNIPSRVVLNLAGEFVLSAGADGEVLLRQGESVFVPHAAGPLSVRGDGRVVVAYVP